MKSAAKENLEKTFFKLKYELFDDWRMITKMKSNTASNFHQNVN